MKISFLFCICIFFALSAPAQFTSLRVGVDGLTCSQCSRSVELRLRKLDFVKSVQMDLKHTQGVLALKANTKVAFDQVAQAITDAGFSVRYIEADYKPGAGEQVQASCFMYQNTCYQLRNGTLPATEKVWRMRFVDKGMIDPVSYKRYHSAQIATDCTCGSGKKYFFVIP